MATPIQTQPSDHTVTFDRLFERHRSVVFAWLLGQTGDREAALDLLQETFVRVWTHHEEAVAMPSKQSRYWVMAIARNVMTDSRRRKAVRAHLGASMPPEAASKEQSPADSAIEQETMEALNHAILELPEELRTVLTMSVIGEQTSEEIGRLLGRPAGTVRYQLSQARERIARKMGCR